MAINKYEKEKLTKQIRLKLLECKFTFSTLDISERKTGELNLAFNDASHPMYKSVRLMSNSSFVKETTLFTMVYINLRFLHGLRTSPIIGHKIISFNVTLS